jgi:hypothetical protein
MAMSEWLGKPRPRLEDVKATHPSLVKDFPTIAAFFPEDQKFRVTLLLDHDELEAFRAKVEKEFGEFTADTAREATGRAVRKWLGGRK